MSEPNACECDYDPQSRTYGPAQECPEHGDVRLYAHWVEELRTERDALRAQVEAVEEVLDVLTLLSEVKGFPLGDAKFMQAIVSDFRRALSSSEPQP